jgi:hypothetical protein
MFVITSSDVPRRWAMSSSSVDERRVKRTTASRVARFEAGR